jgi:hypothetical protein
MSSYHDCHFHPRMKLNKNCHPAVFGFSFVVYLDFAATTELEKGSCICVLEGCFLVL